MTVEMTLALDLKAFKVLFAFGRGGAENKLALTDAETETSFSDCAVIRSRWFYSDDTSGSYFAFWEEDCAWPAIFIVQARRWEDAYEVFCDEFASEMSNEDYDALTEEEREGVQISGGGKLLANHEAINGQEIEFAGVERVK